MKTFLKDLEEHIAQTHSDKYSNGIETIDYLFAKGVGRDFCIANIIKYATRFKERGNQEDLLKIAHYAGFLYSDRKTDCMATSLASLEERAIRLDKRAAEDRDILEVLGLDSKGKTKKILKRP